MQLDYRKIHREVVTRLVHEVESRHSLAQKFAMIERVSKAFHTPTDGLARLFPRQEDVENLLRVLCWVAVATEP